TLAAAPVIGLYILMSQQFIKGLTAGAVKGEPRGCASHPGREIRRCEQRRPDVFDNEALSVRLLARRVPFGVSEEGAPAFLALVPGCELGDIEELVGFADEGIPEADDFDPVFFEEPHRVVSEA